MQPFKLAFNSQPYHFDSGVWNDASPPSSNEQYKSFMLGAWAWRKKHQDEGIHMAKNTRSVPVRVSRRPPQKGRLMAMSSARSPNPAFKNAVRGGGGFLAGCARWRLRIRLRIRFLKISPKPRVLSSPNGATYQGAWVIPSRHDAYHASITASKGECRASSPGFSKAARSIRNTGLLTTNRHDREDIHGSGSLARSKKKVV